MRRILVGLLSIGVVAGLAPGVALASPEAGPPARVSGQSPFAGCSPADLDGGLPEGEVEPFVDVDPTDPGHLVAVWTQDRFRGLVAGVSFDGGDTWRRVVLPGMSRCTGGAFDYVDDAWVSFGPDGVVHVSAHVFDDSQISSGLVVARSTDGGLTWSRPVLLAEEGRSRAVNYSGGAITADPRDPDLVYSIVPEFAEPTDDDGFFRGRVYFARSRDGGKTWRPARQIFDTGKGGLTTGHQIVVLPDGTLLDVFTLIDFRAGQQRPALRVAVMRSTNQGRSWSRPRLVAKLRSAGTTDPQTGDPVAAGSKLLTDAAVDPGTGRVYLVWQDARFSGGRVDAIALSSSADGGRTWTEPAKVNATPTDIPSRNQQAFTASVDVAAGGTVAVSYSDFRHNGTGTALPTDRWLARCHPTARTSCTTAGSFGSEVRLTRTSFDMRQAPWITVGPGGFFLGDYMGLTHAGHDFLALFAQPHGDDPTSVFARRVSSRPVPRSQPGSR